MDDVQKKLEDLSLRVSKLESYLKYMVSYELNELIKNGDVKWEIGLNFKENKNE